MRRPAPAKAWAQLLESSSSSVRLDGAWYCSLSSTRRDEVDHHLAVQVCGGDRSDQAPEVEDRDFVSDLENIVEIMGYKNDPETAFRQTPGQFEHHGGLGHPQS